jgi:hypothetical protein
MRNIAFNNDADANYNRERHIRSHAHNIDRDAAQLTAENVAEACVSTRPDEGSGGVESQKVEERC